jgi:hypothetical protein
MRLLNPQRFLFLTKRISKHMIIQKCPEMEEATANLRDEISVILKELSLKKRDFIQRRDTNADFINNSGQNLLLNFHV